MFFHRLNDRHSLRQIALGDAEELFAVIEANRAHLRRWLPWLRPHPFAGGFAPVRGGRRAAGGE
ncbi:MAG: hypothetical protein WDN28_01930 [Chthoniobacter sp.]